MAVWTAATWDSMPVTDRDMREHACPPNPPRIQTPNVYPAQSNLDKQWSPGVGSMNFSVPRAII